MRQGRCGKWVAALSAAVAICTAGAGCHSWRLVINVERPGDCGTACAPAPVCCEETCEVSGPAVVTESPCCESVQPCCDGAQACCDGSQTCCDGGAVGRRNNGPIPRELMKVSLPEYVIEPPDVLLIDTAGVIPLPPYKIEPLDTLQIFVSGTPATEPITGTYGVEPDGTINLGPTYGSVPVVGLSIDAAKKAIEDRVRQILANARVHVSLAQFRGMQQIRGEHLVRLDGTLGLGIYGSVRVAGMTIREAKAAIEAQLSAYLKDPEISLDVSGFNSKVYYVITDAAGLGDRVYRYPIEGGETVLDAISRVGGIPADSSKHKIWVARPAPCEHCETTCDQILRVDWCGITQRGQTCTNYQLMPGDRVFVKGDSFYTFYNVVDKIVAPFERMFGFTLLGAATVQQLQSFGGGGGGTGGSGGGIFP